MSANIPVTNLGHCLTERFTYRFWKRILDLLVSVLVLILLGTSVGADCSGPETEFLGSGLFQAAARGTIRQTILDLQVHHHDTVERGRERYAVVNFTGRTGHPSGPNSAAGGAGRAASAHQCAARRHEPGWTAPGEASLR